MSKLKLFLENFLVYGIGGVISKIIPLIMVPIVTRIMPNSSFYGISDMQNTLVSFCSAIAVLGMYDAMYRMFFEKDSEEFKKDICSTALLCTLVLSIIVSMLMVIFRSPISLIFFGDIKYVGLVDIAAITTLSSSTNQIVSAPTRMRNQRKIYLIMNTISPILSYAVSVPLLLSGHYLVALPIGAMISGISSEVIFWALNKEWFHIKKFNKENLKELLKIAFPLFPNFIIYWVFNSSDKLMITQILGTSATGLYSVGSKLGLASQLIYTAFAGGWQYFAFSTMNEKDQVESNSHVFEYLGIISYICTAFICLIASPFYSLLFTGEYATSYIIAPYLFLAPLLQMLFQVEANQFLVIKKTWPNMLILSTGALSNIFFNFLLIPKIGIEGASIATLIGYIISVIICTSVLIRMRLMIISKKFLVCSFLMITFFTVWRLFTLKSFATTFICSFIFTLILLLVYRSPVYNLIHQIKNKE